MAGMYDGWSVASNLTNIRLVLQTIVDKREIHFMDVADALHQIDVVRQKLGLPAEDAQAKKKAAP